MPFDPNKPYVVRDAGFDPSKPFVDAPPAAKPTPKGMMGATARARADLLAQQARDAAAGNDGQGKPFIQAATFNLMDELSGAKAAIDTGAGNLVRKVQGRPIAYGMGDAYKAGRDLFREQETAERKDTPHGALMYEETLGGIGGSLGGMRSVGGAVLKAPPLAGKMVRGAAAGAGYGAAYGAGGAKEGERLKGAGEGAAWGAAAGAVLPPAFALGGKVLRPVLAPVMRQVQPLLDRLAAAGGETVTAEQLAARERALATPPKLRAAKAIKAAVDRDEAAGQALRPGVKPIYAGGDNLTSLYEVAAKSPGPARTMIRRAVADQRGAVPTEVEQDLANAMGAHGDYFATLEQRQIDRANKSREHFDAAYAQPIDADLFNERVAPILGRLPRGTLEDAYDLARRAGRNPEEMGLMSLDSFGGHDVGGKTPLDLVSADDLSALRRGVNPKISQGPTLGEYLARAGGINDLGGDLANIGAKDWHRARPFLGKLLKEGGMSPEDAARRAHEAGYFPDKFTPSMDSGANMHPVGPEDLLGAIQDEIAGRPRYARSPDPAAVARRDRLDGLERQLRDAGVDPTRTNQLGASRAVTAYNEDIARLEAHADGDPVPMSPNEPTTTFNPKLETLHWVKMALDQKLEKYRNPVTGKLELEDAPEAIADDATRRDLVMTMRGMNGDYNQGMKIWGDESARKEALQLGRMVLSDKMNMSPERLTERVRDMSDAEHADFSKGVGEALLHKVRGSGGDIRVMRDLMRDRNFASKVALAFPDDASFNAFLETADRRVREADINSRIIGGSPTYPLAAARADLEAEGAHPLDVLGDALSGGVVGAGRKALGAGLKAIPRKSRSVIGDPQANALLGKTAVDPNELTALLNLLEAQRARQGRWAGAGGYLAAPAAGVAEANGPR